MVPKGSNSCVMKVFSSLLSIQIKGACYNKKVSDERPRSDHRNNTKIISYGKMCFGNYGIGSVIPQNRVFAH